MTGRPRIVASIEARMGSSRLPGKVLADVGGRPALSRLLARLRRAELIDDIVLATTDLPADDALAAWAAAEGVAIFRGSESDVLKRVVEAQKSRSGEIVVEVTGDSILLDPEVIDWGVATFLANDVDIAANVAKPSFPQGVDVQVFPLTLLAEVEGRVADPAVREHVSLYFYENPQHYRIHHLTAPPRYRGPGRRFQLDYPEDLAFIRAVYRRLEPAYGDAFGTPEILALLEAEPAIAALNRDCAEKPVR